MYISDRLTDLRATDPPWLTMVPAYGASMANIVDEVLFVTDMETAFTAAANGRPTIFAGRPIAASTIVQIQRLAFPDLMIEIKCVAKV